MMGMAARRSLGDEAVSAKNKKRKKKLKNAKSFTPTGEGETRAGERSVAFETVG
jgi:hypothetical protein